MARSRRWFCGLVTAFVLLLGPTLAPRVAVAQPPPTVGIILTDPQTGRPALYAGQLATYEVVFTGTPVAAGDPVTVTLGAGTDLSHLTASNVRLSLNGTYYDISSITQVGTSFSFAAPAAITPSAAAIVHIASVHNPAAGQKQVCAPHPAPQGPCGIYTILPGPQLQVLLPGETAAPGTLIGKLGTPTPQTAGIPFTITINAVDSHWNRLPSANDTLQLSSTDTGAVLPNSVQLDDGTVQVRVMLPTAGTQRITAADTGDNDTASGTSSNVTVLPGPLAKLQVLLPGETAAPGSALGKTGTPAPQVSGQAFTVTVNAVDAYWNKVPGVTDLVSFTSSDARAVLPPNTHLSAATLALPVQLITNGTSTITAHDVTNAVILPGTSSGVTVTGEAPPPPPPPPPPPTLVSIRVQGETTVAAGNTATYTALGTYSNGSTGGVAVTWTASGGTITSAGVWTAPTVPGTYTITATAPGNNGTVTGTLAVTVTHSGATVVELRPTTPVTLPAGQSFTFTYVAWDAYGNPVTDVPPIWSSTGVGSVVNGTFSSTTVGGALVTVAVGGAHATSAPITVVPGPAALVHVTASRDHVAPGDHDQFQATVTDAYGNLISGAAVTWSATGGTIASTGDRTGDFTAGLTAHSATITATYQQLHGSATITISQTACGDDSHPQALVLKGELAPSSQATPSDAVVLVPPVQVVGTTGTSNVAFAVPGGLDSDPTNLVYAYDARLAAWIALPTERTACGAVADVPVGLPTTLMKHGIAPFADVIGTWANPYVLELQSLGIVHGAEDGHFHPTTSVSRYQLTVLLSLALHLDASPGNLTGLETQPDAAQMPNWAKPYVAAVIRHHVMVGTGTGFAGATPTTRAQMAAIIGRILPAGSPSLPLQFGDAAAIPTWAQAGAETSLGADILVSYPDGAFRPDRPLTRAEIAKVFALLVDTLSSMQ